MDIDKYNTRVRQAISEKEVAMRRYMLEPTLKNYVARYKKDKELLEKHPEHKELLGKRIARHEKDIVAYVTSKRFECALNKRNIQGGARQMKFYHMSEFTETTTGLNGNKVVVHLDEGEVSTDKFEEYRKDFYEYVDYGVLRIDHIDTETNTVYFYSDIV